MQQLETFQIRGLLSKQDPCLKVFPAFHVFFSIPSAGQSSRSGVSLSKQGKLQICLASGFLACSFLSQIITSNNQIIISELPSWKECWFVLSRDNFLLWFSSQEEMNGCEVASKQKSLSRRIGQKLFDFSNVPSDRKIHLQRFGTA